MSDGTNKKRDLSAAIITVGVLLVVAFAAVMIILPSLHPSTTLHLGDGVFRAKLAITEQERRQGLGGVKSLAENEAMLFVFDDDQKWGIWMDGMLISIDVVWLNKDKEVVHIVKNIPPESAILDVIYRPKEPARYVVELPAGTVDKKSIKTGQEAVFEYKYKGKEI